MNIMIHREGQDFGPYTIEQVKDYLADGTLKESDMAWPEGGNEWIPLKTAMSRLPAEASGSAAIPAAPEKRGLEHNPYFSGCVYGTGALMLLALIILCLFPAGLLDLFSPTINIGPVSVRPMVSGSYMILTSDEKGGVLVADMKTDYTGDKLRDSVMEHIYSLTADSSTVTTLKMTIHQTGGFFQKDASVEVHDLDSVRKYSDKKSFASSAFRNVIDLQLKSAGL